ncbi:MAG: TIGR00159 family protein, partial [Levilactobacillus sp.]|nr:TIGR00159 family protein [Levilactobacillus sp.]
MNLDWGNLLTIGNLVNLLDILVVWFVIYELIVMLRGTKAIQLFRGVILILIVRFVSAYMGLNTVSWLVDQVINWGVIA